jgi:hypothetical protein
MNKIYQKTHLYLSEKSKAEENYSKTTKELQMKVHEHLQLPNRRRYVRTYNGTLKRIRVKICAVDSNKY